MHGWRTISRPWGRSLLLRAWRQAGSVALHSRSVTTRTCHPCASTSVLCSGPPSLRLGRVIVRGLLGGPRRGVKARPPLAKARSPPTAGASESV